MAFYFNDDPLNDCFNETTTVYFANAMIHELPKKTHSETPEPALTLEEEMVLFHAQQRGLIYNYQMVQTFKWFGRLVGFVFLYTTISSILTGPVATHVAPRIQKGFVLMLESKLLPFLEWCGWGGSVSAYIESIHLHENKVLYQQQLAENALYESSWRRRILATGVHLVIHTFFNFGVGWLFGSSAHPQPNSVQNNNYYINIFRVGLRAVRL